MNENKNYSKNEFIFIAVLLCMAVCLSFLVRMLQQENGAYVQITIDGEMAGTYSLSDEKTFMIETKDNHYNKIVIKQGEIYISESDCPDLLCVKQGAIHKNAQTIICLPHKVAITVFANDVNEIDAVTN